MAKACVTALILDPFAKCQLLIPIFKLEKNYMYNLLINNATRNMNTDPSLK